MRRFSCILLLLTTLLLSGCVRDIEPDFTKPTEPTAPSISQTAPTTPTAAVTPNNTPTNVKLMPATTVSKEEFQNFLNESYWYARALGCHFEKPELIQTEWLFRNSLVADYKLDNTTFTNEERAFLHSRWCEKYGEMPWVDALKIPARLINEGLAVLHVTLKDVKIPEDWVYYDKTDAFYAYKPLTDTVNTGKITVTNVVKNNDGAVQVYWETDDAYTDTATGNCSTTGAKMVLTLKKQNNAYVVCSNVPGEYIPPAIADLPDVENVQKYLQDQYWYIRALACTFENPQEINLDYFFRNGLDPVDRVSITDEEQAFLDATYKKKYGTEPTTPAYKLPAAEINKALSILGIDMNTKRMPDDWVYYHNTDSYYFWQTDTFALEDWNVIWVEQESDGILKVYWETEKKHLNTDTGKTWDAGVKMVMTMQKQANAGYRILSNMPVEPGKLVTNEDYRDFLMGEYWYYRALGCTFEKPEDISAKFFFYGGLSQKDPDPYDTPITPDERAYIDEIYRQKNDGRDPYTDATKLPVQSMNNALSILGITVEDIEIPDHWVYYDKADAYYFWVSDAFGVGGVTVTQVTKAPDGKISVYWETGGMHHNTSTGEFWENGVKMVMTLQEKTDGTLQVLSNLPAE